MKPKKQPPQAVSRLDDPYSQFKIRRNLSLRCFANNTTTTTTQPPLPQSDTQNSNYIAGFNRLPTETLLQIFGYLLTSSTPIIIDDFKKQDAASTKSCYSNFTNKPTYNYIGACAGLFLASRHISDAALTTLYSTNIFILRLRVNFTRSWLLSIGRENRDRLVKLEVGIYSRISQSGWGENLKREFAKLGGDFSVMRRLRRVDYKLEWIHGRDTPGRYETCDEIIEAERGGMVEVHERLLKIYDEGPKPVIRVNIHQNSIQQVEPSPPSSQQQSKFLSLPDDIIRRILNHAHTEDKIYLLSPHNYNGVKELPGPKPTQTIIGMVLKHHSPCYGYFSLLLTCKILSEMMREMIYSRSSFKLRERAFATFSNAIDARDLCRITRLELILGDPNQKRVVYNILCVKGILHRLVNGESRIKYLEICAPRVMVPYISTLRPLLQKLKEREGCNVVVTETDKVVVEDTQSITQAEAEKNDISWILDMDSNVVWAWGWKSQKWGHMRSTGEIIFSDGTREGGGSGSSSKQGDKSEEKVKESGEEGKKRQKVRKMLKKLKL
ncbi:hypothetical protein TWF694_003082 [Orbilia ellipsospora]|uniref:F-box domain-containing protein n=1 Tax=Orbilia ellipsospora TaxID=2528407 RepID=A0AAV9X2Y6_9PEZI